MRGKFTLLFALLTVFALSSSAGAIDLTGKKGINLNVGAAVLTQDITSNIEGKTGPIIGGRILYGINNYLTVGFEIEWETHKVELLKLNMGDYNTVSILPLVQIRSSNMGQFSPFMTMGAGYNINSFNQSALFDAVCVADYGVNCEIDPDDTLAVKVGVGFDYFFAEGAAVNIEVNWKLNSGDIDYGIPGAAKDNAEGSVVNFSAGVSLFF